MTIAVDLSKTVFEIAVSNQPGKVRERKRLSRGQMLRFFANRPAATVLLEACGSAHHWARQLEKLGHRVLLLPVHQTRRYVLRDKTDAADAFALLEAHRNEQIVPVPIKTVHQQTLAALHRIRSGWMQTRTARLNAIRGLLRELGVFIPQGARQVLPALQASLSDPDNPLPLQLHPTLLTLGAEIRTLEQNIKDSERQLASAARRLPQAERYLSIPGIGLLTATALCAFVGNLSRFPFRPPLRQFPRLSPQRAFQRPGPSPRRNHQTRRSLSAYPLDPRRTIRPARRFTLQTPRPTPILGPPLEPTPRSQPHCHRPSQQTRSHRLGRRRPPDQLPDQSRLRRKPPLP